MNVQKQKAMEIIPMSIKKPTTETVLGIIENHYRSAGTLRRYRTVIKEFMGLGYGFCGADFKAYIKGLANSPVTINNKIAIIKAVSGLLLDKDIITPDNHTKMRRIKKLRVSRDVDGNWLSAASVVEVIKSTTHDVMGWRDKALISTLFATGLRREELSALRWDHLQWYEDSLEIRGLKTKGDLRRNLVIQGFAIIPLLDWGAEVARQFQLETDEGLPIIDFPVFLSVKRNEEIDPVAKGLSGSGVHQIVVRCGRNAGLTLRPHDCRRTYASLLMDAGIPAQTIQAMLGHSTLLTTERYLNPMSIKRGIHDRMIILD